MLPDVFLGANPWLYFSGSSIVSELSLCGPIPKQSGSLRNLWVDVIWRPTFRSD